MDRPTLKALYFPFSRCLSPLTLKRALLLFDEIIFIDPIAMDIVYENPGTVIVPRDQVNIYHRAYRSPWQGRYGVMPGDPFPQCQRL
jgi:hypothetical protein